MLNSDFEEPSNALGTQYTNLYDLNPELHSDWTIDDASPLRDKGLESELNVGEFDVAGHPRIYNDLPDVGAYEIQDVIFAYDFDIDLNPN